MQGLKIGLLSVCLISTFSFSSIAQAGERWPEPEKRGRCPVNQVCDQYRTYEKPADARGIAGFYVNLTSPDSSALIRWKHRLCNGEAKEGSQEISTSSTGKNYIDFPESVCSFTFNVVDAKNYRGNETEIQFLMNFDVDY